MFMYYYSTNIEILVSSSAHWPDKLFRYEDGPQRMFLDVRFYDAVCIVTTNKKVL